MKHPVIKTYEQFNDADPYGEEQWVDVDFTLLHSLKDDDGTIYDIGKDKRGGWELRKNGEWQGTFSSLKEILEQGDY